jgi:hypothetical protein
MRRKAYSLRAHTPITSHQKRSKRTTCPTKRCSNTVLRAEALDTVVRAFTFKDGPNSSPLTSKTPKANPHVAGESEEDNIFVSISLIFAAHHM